MMPRYLESMSEVSVMTRMKRVMARYLKSTSEVPVMTRT